jgi:hypothetical protein
VLKYELLLRKILVMKKMRIVFVVSFFWSLVLGAEPNLQVLLENLDKEISFSNGISEARLLKKKGNILQRESKVFIYKQKENLVLSICNLLGKEEWRILSKDRGNKIFFTSLPSYRIYKKTNPTRYENIPFYFFSYEDLSDLKREERFLSKSFSEYQAQSNIYWKVETQPLEPEGYSKVYFYFSQKDNSPYRIDFYDLEGRFYKIIRLEYGEVVFEDSQGKQEKKRRISTIKSTDINTEELSILEIVKVKEANFEKLNLFNLNNFTIEKEGIFP